MNDRAFQAAQYRYDNMLPEDPDAELFEAVDEEASWIWSSEKDLQNILIDEGVELPMAAVCALLHGATRLHKQRPDLDTPSDAFLRLFEEWLHGRVWKAASAIVEARREFQP
jgi:hypothetical protein